MTIYAIVLFNKAINALLIDFGGYFMTRLYQHIKSKTNIGLVVYWAAKYHMFLYCEEPSAITVEKRNQGEKAGPSNQISITLTFKPACFHTTRLVSQMFKHFCRQQVLFHKTGSTVTSSITSCVVEACGLFHPWIPRVVGSSCQEFIQSGSPVIILVSLLSKCLKHINVWDFSGFRWTYLLLLFSLSLKGKKNMMCKWALKKYHSSSRQVHWDSPGFHHRQEHTGH